MKKSNEYRAIARENLAGRWGEAAVMSLIVVGLGLLFNVTPALVDSDPALRLSLNGAGFAVTLLLLVPLEFGMFNSVLSVLRKEENDTMTGMMFKFFSGDYARYVIAMVLQTLIIAVLSVLTLGIAGIIFSYAYKMVPFLLRDYPELSAKEALKLSREMMRGAKWDLFVLDLSFIGWYILGVLTCGILFLWVTPYIYMAEASFYEDLKNESIVEENV